MSPRSKKEYLKTIFLRYKKAFPKEKTVILNEFHKWGKIFTGCCPKVEMTILDGKVVWDKNGLTNNPFLSEGRQFTLC